jgi:hypothetical protein
MAVSSGYLYRKILLISRDPELGAELTKAIEGEGCLVAGPFPYSELALEFLANDCPDLALIDSLNADPQSHELIGWLAEDAVPQVFFNGFDRDRRRVRVEEEDNPGFCRDLTVPELLQVLNRNAQQPSVPA